MNILEELNRLFQAQPDKPAITGSSGELTYGQLDAITRHVAYMLRSKGIGKQDVITVETESKIEAIVLLLGVVRAGAAYCVIPADYPEHRKNMMRRKVQAKTAIGSLEFSSALDMQTQGFTENDEPANRDDDSLLYVIFTSGSTGEPKAVAIKDRAISKIVNHKDFYEGEVLGQFAPLEFDASVYEVFGGLLNGMTLRMVSKDESLDFDILPEIVKEIDTVFLTTRLFNLYVDECPDVFRSLKRVLTGGERCSIRHQQEAARFCKVFNVYGPTETTVYATKYEVRGNEKDIPIGKLFDNGCYRVMNEEGEEAVPGQPGELYISDSGLMAGYMGDTEANDKAFYESEGRRYYRTGDIVLENVDGDLVYVERKDRQVKISGYRIELGEIERCAREYGLRKDCVAHYDGKKLYLYITDEDAGLEAFRQHLRSRLPDYMIPTVKIMEHIPINGNGKTDVKAVLETEEGGAGRDILDVVENVLRSKVALEKTFLDLGGDSIKAMEIIWQLGGKGYQLDLDMLFSRTIGEIVDHVKAG